MNERNLTEIMSVQPAGESELATYWWVDEHTLYAKSKPTDRTVKTISENVALVKGLHEQQPVKLIISIAKSKVPDKETRDLAAKELPLTYSAMAMITSSKLAGFIINLIYGMKKPPIPIRVFRSFETAQQWISTI